MSDVELLINSKSFSGWKTVDINRSIQQIAGSFELSVSGLAPNGDAATAIKPGARASVLLAGTTVITGFVDEIAIEHSTTGHGITVRGRDASGDLVDCSAINGSGEWTNQDMLAIVGDLVKPFGVKVTSDTDVGKPFFFWTIEPGETVFESIDKLARHRGVLVVSDGQGGIRLTTPGASRVSTALILGQNILSANITLSHAQRFRNYYVLGQRAFDDNNIGTQCTEQNGQATDAAVARYRPLIEVIEAEIADDAVLEDRARWRSAVNAAKGQQVTVTVQGWSHQQGLWQPNTLVTMRHAPLRINNTQLLIAGVRHTLNEQGSRTELTLAPRDAYKVEVIPDDSLGGA